MKSEKIQTQTIMNVNIISKYLLKLIYVNNIKPLFEIKERNLNPAEKIHVWINTTFLYKLIQLTKNELLLTKWDGNCKNFSPRNSIYRAMTFTLFVYLAWNTNKSFWRCYLYGKNHFKQFVSTLCETISYCCNLFWRFLGYNK